MKLEIYSYKAWIVDLDGTLYVQWPVRLAMGVELALGNWRHVHLLQSFRREQERLREVTEALPCDPFAIQIQAVADRFSVPVEHVELVVTKWMIERPCKWLVRFRRKHLIRQIEEHRRRGGVTAVVSDYPAKRKLAHMGLTGLFEAVVASGDSTGLRRLKPAPDGVLLAADELGCPVETCVVIGDRSDTDGEAARRAGMSFFHVTKGFDRLNHENGSPRASRPQLRSGSKEAFYR